ncbi:maltose permease MAL31 [Talaromyces proteolyticus]|uniref:Maltose permease MAL31 n=1 Tax=Talaromyces proteolyticus TaxID=1131652 RepID=A0AAD4L7X5_9EURO|nr:maltose permease MAL31 [Talaromyces proteolyticus]KAH8705544.1 maltose permease MAL31 [Talaromyces proteolyticus]
MEVDTQGLNQQAKIAEDEQHKQSVWEALWAHPKAVFWSFMVSMCVIMEGYDTILLGNFFAYPQFARKFGTWIPSENQYQLTASWQAGLNNASGVGAFFGAIANGYLVDRFGQKRVILASLVGLSMLLFIVFFAPNIEALLIGELLCGFPWGIFATASPAYASEVLPLSLRVYMTSWTNMCFIIGQLIAAGVLAGLVDVSNEWSYRIPFAIQWVWPCFLFPILCFAPESPWHLVRKDRLDEAKKSLERLIRSKEPDGSPNLTDIDNTLALIIHTDRMEREELKIKTTYWQCFRGIDRRRTEIACVSFVGQVTAGMGFAYNSTYFFQQVGLTTDQTYKMNIGVTGLGLFGTLMSWLLVLPRFGRRTIYLAGMLICAIILFIIGILTVDTSHKSIGMAQAVLCLVWTFFFQLTIGQLGWSLPAEIGSTRLRQKTVVLARDFYYIASTISSVLQPYFMNPTAWNLKGYTGFFWGSTALLTFVWAFFRLPETKGRSYDELNMLFSNHIAARSFQNCEVSSFEKKDSGEKEATVHVEKIDG